MNTLPQHVLELTRQVAVSNGVDVLEASVRNQGRSRVLAVVLDADAPIEADVVERVSRELSQALDAADPLPGAYLLEVTTPGLDRPLLSARDFRRQLGHEVRVTRAAGATAGAVQGRVVAADAEAVVLEVSGAQERVPLSDVVAGKVVLPW